jgi:hypothetical protein
MTLTFALCNMPYLVKRKISLNNTNTKNLFIAPQLNLKLVVWIEHNAP